MTEQEIREPTIDWLIDQLNSSNAPLVKLNKDRLRKLIQATVAEAETAARIETIDKIKDGIAQVDNPYSPALVRDLVSFKKKLQPAKEEE